MNEEEFRDRLQAEMEQNNAELARKLKAEEDQRRVRKIAVDPTYLLQMVTGREAGEYFSVLEFARLPKGYTVKHVEFSIVHGSFMFVVQHPSFEIVPLGDIVPTHGAGAFVMGAVYRRVELPK
jgi:hypothetical protein